ncbi:MAG: biliverdin-producing heme oxygenase [Cellvibrionaceae bacterium]|nr:biliverdin-producing heme oxygenase [Cellvibrionaceae bacterium]
MLPNSSNLHQQLKSATAAIHEALHRQPLLQRLMEPDCTLDEYRSVLAVFQQFHLRAETRLGEIRYPRFAGEAPVLTWLSEDIHVVGSDLMPLDHQFDGNIIKSVDLSNYLGYLYVKQGSTLGGQVLCRRLSRSLALTPERGLRFFPALASRHARTGYISCIISPAKEAEIDTSRVIASACEYFQALEIMLNQAMTEVAC